jgi:predicted Na+-dependent transporter
VQRKFWNLPTKTTQADCILFCRAAKNLGIYQQKQLRLTVFYSAAQRFFLNLPTNDCILLCCADKNSALATKSTKQSYGECSDWLVIVMVTVTVVEGVLMLLQRSGFWIGCLIDVLAC